MEGTTLRRLPCWYFYILTVLCSLIGDTVTYFLSIVHMGIIRLFHYTDCKPGNIILFSNELGHNPETFKIIFI